MSFDNAFDALKARGFYQQVTDEQPLYELLGKESVTFYVGIDPTADSLHVGHLLPVMGMAHMQKYGHRPIAVVGGGTAMVGDPSGKTSMRQMLTREQIQYNSQKIKSQLSRYLDFSEDKAILVDNYDWLGNINYIEFLRDIGKHFSVNRMLTFETYKRRMETGLSFLEFNYQLLQAYDFYMLYKKYGCRLQMGGDDQWANILAGADLIRRMEAADAFGHTFPLITTASGGKMGKTEKGAVWLDPQKTPPYEYFQYWVNCDDRDVKRFTAFFTFLPIDEIEKIDSLEGAEINIAKTILAYEATKLTHGEDRAKESMQAASAAFGGREIPADLLRSSTIPRGAIKSQEANIPSAEITLEELSESSFFAGILVDVGLVKSRGEARRLIKQGGVYLNEERVTDSELEISEKDFVDGKLAIRLGKKRHFNLILSK